MSKRKYDLGDLVAAVSELDTTAAAPQLQLVPLENIVVNKDNFYKLTALDALADSIAMDGLQQPLVVTAIPAEPGTYRLISGHRRRAAIEKLVKDKENPREDLRLVPCMVKTYSSPAMEELQLILANSTARVLSNAEVMKQAEKMEMLLYQLKEEGYEFPGRMRDQVAAACKVSAPKLARLKVIREKLIADFMYLFEKDKLSEQAAYAIARMPVEFQSRLAKVRGDREYHGYDMDEILARYGKGWRWEPELTCPDGKACRRGDSFLLHDIEHRHDMCGGNKCCLECSRATDRYSPCDRMCSKAQARRKDARDEAAAKEQERLEKASRKYEKETQHNAQRLLRAIEAAGLPDNAKFNWRNYWTVVTVEKVRKYAAGEFSDILSCAELDPSRLENPKALAELLGCSTDYLLGLTEDLTPVAYEANKEPDEPKPEPAAETRSASAWIPLSEHHPKDGQLCFVIDGCGDVEYAKYESGEWIEGANTWRTLLYDQEISYWMPAPDLPEEVR